MTTTPRRAPVTMPGEPSPVASDRLDGAGQIAAFWYGADNPDNRRRVFRLADRGEPPIGKMNGRLIASRTVLTEVYRQLTGGAEAEPQPEPRVVLRRRA